MSDLEEQRLGTPVSGERGVQRAAAGATPGHLDLSAAEQAERAEPGSETLGPGAARWAQSLLEVARFELARADDKASTLFRFYGVVAALSIGLLAGNGWSPSDLAIAAQVLFWAGAGALLASGLFLGMTLYPRDIQGTPAKRLLYFGHVIAFQSVDELASALRSVEEDAEHRLVEQLLDVSRLVHAKYALTRKALVALGAGTALCLAAVIVDSIAKNA
jgi:Family of unknown function (DUF5706)